MLMAVAVSEPIPATLETVAGATKQSEVGAVNDPEFTAALAVLVVVGAADEVLACEVLVSVAAGPPELDADAHPQASTATAMPSAVASLPLRWVLMIHFPL
jgi:hypothetical protein